MTGTLPWSVHERSKFNFEKTFVELMVEDASTVINLVRTSSQKKHVVERLVMQLKQDSLQKLLYLLEPKHAWLIISYIADLKSFYIIKPILQISKKAFSRLLWILTINYSVKEHGSQFNRQSFVKTLLKSMARSEGLEYTALLDALNLRLQENAKSSFLQSSLPALIARLAEEQSKVERTKLSGVLSNNNKLENEREIMVSDEVWNEREGHNKLDLKLVNGLASFEYYLNRARPIEKNVVGTSQLKGDLGEFLELVERYDKTSLGLSRQLIKSLTSNFSRDISLVTERLLTVISPSILLEILKVKNKEKISEWAEMLADAFNYLSEQVPRSNVLIKASIWQAILQFLMSNKPNSWHIQSMFESTISMVAKSLGMDMTDLFNAVARMSEINVREKKVYALIKWIDTLKSTPLVVQQESKKIDDGYLLLSVQVKHLFESYDREKTIDFFLRSDVLPWQVVWCQPDATVTRYLSDLDRKSVV